MIGDHCRQKDVGLTLSCGGVSLGRGNWSLDSRSELTEVVCTVKGLNAYEPRIQFVLYGKTTRIIMNGVYTFRIYVVS